MEEPFQPYSNYFSNSYMSISKGGVYLSPPPTLSPDSDI